jgi:hypothetical protein
MKLLGLPNEIWIKILANLKQRELLNTSLVSKKLRELALDPALWTELVLEDYIEGKHGVAFNQERCQGRNSPISKIVCIVQ